MMEEFGNRLATFRKQKGLTQIELANRLDMTLSTYKQLEYKTKSPKLSTLESLLVALDLKLDQFIPELCSKTQELGEQEQELFTNFNRLNPEQKAKVIELIKLM